MKKILLFSLFILISQTSFSQINYGFKFGLDLSLKYESNENTNEIPIIYGTRYGYVFGVYRTY